MKLIDSLLLLSSSKENHPSEVYLGEAKGSTGRRADARCLRGYPLTYITMDSDVNLLPTWVTYTSFIFIHTMYFTLSDYETHNL